MQLPTSGMRIYLLALQRQTRRWKRSTKLWKFDPLSPIINVNVGDALYYSGKLAESLKFYEKAREILPGFVPSYYSEIQPLCYLKMFNEVLEIIDEYARIAKSTTIRLLRAYVSAHMGKRDEARKTLMELEVELESDHGSFSWYFVALAYFLLGNKDKGFELLEKAYDLGEHEYSICKSITSWTM